jgi:two-component system chemotaxis sensor kinase CheA
MPGIDFDPEILQEFLTESGELLESLESDLVELEDNNTDGELINKAFRALHTIKGSASFLALTELVSIAHAAETALNAARSGDAVVDGHLMDLLLRAVDQVKQHMGEIESGAPSLTEPDPALVEELTAIGEGRAPATGGAPAGDAPADGGGAGDNGSRRLELDPGKADLLDHFVADLDAQLARLGEQIETLADEHARAGVPGELEEIGGDLHATIDFFDFESMGTLAGALIESALAAAQTPGVEFDQALPRMRALLSLIVAQRDALAKGELVEPEQGDLVAHLRSVVGGGGIEDAWRLPAGADAETAMRIDNALATVREIQAEADAALAGGTPAAGEHPDTPKPGVEIIPEPADSAPAKSDEPGDEGSKGKARAAAVVEKTLRVEVSRLESLMNLVGELVLQKNRICELSRTVGALAGVPAEMSEPLEIAGAGLDRLTSEIQVAVMRTRMQPLDKLFGKYPRLIRDLSKKTGKQLELKIVGGETEVDKQVIEELGDPLVHLLRNSADHGIEMPQDRVAAGKPAQGTITLRAAHQGNHAVISISDDGKGLSRDVIGGKAIEKGLATEAEVAAMSDAEVFKFIFAAGFSTAAQVSDLSGRGVGMDVVRTNIERIKGTIDIQSVTGKGTTLSIMIPLTVAILPAMMVKVSGEIYAIPLSHIIEIVRPGPEELSTILTDRVIRLRGSVFPLLDASERLDAPRRDSDKPNRLAVVLQAEEKTIGLMVEEVIGQQEIVIKPLDGLERTGPFSGATVRNDGGVSLILDVAEMIRTAD